MIQDRGGRGKTPPWLEDPIRGLAFWLGYRQVLFRHHPLTEGAISGELIALVKAAAPAGSALVPEMKYAEIAAGEFGKTRVDFVVGSFARDAGFRVVPEVAVEVKRNVRWAWIERDLRRLLRLLHRPRANATPRAFLIVAYQSGIPHRQFAFQDASTGAFRARLGPLHIETEDGLTGKAFVRRVVRASSIQREEQQSRSTSTHHVCLIEVSK